MTYQTKPISALLVSLLLLAGCSLAPKYERASVDTPATFKEAAANKNLITPDQPSTWKTAQPSEDVARGQWWKVFGDETLNNLEDQALDANQNLKAAVARLSQARALQLDARSGLFPQVTAGVGPTRQRTSPDALNNASGREFTLWRAQANVSYEADLFGRVASTVNASKADVQQSEALLQSVRLALQADVARAYFQLRQLDSEQKLYADTTDLRARSLKLMESRYAAGYVSELEIARAKSELASTQSESLGIARQRANAEHALAILLGKAPAQFSMAPLPLDRITINIPVGLPSSLLERRPDIAAAERAMAAANARIGVARAAYFPNLNITGALGYESSELGDLFQWSNRTFLLGPLVGTMLSLPVFDGGRRQAGVDRAHAIYEEDVANYRQTVLNAFGEVEDNLSGLRILDEQTLTQDAAVQASSRAAHLSQVQYREGSVSNLDVIDAERTVLQQQLVSRRLDGERAQATVNLIRAIGGGWDDSTKVSTNQ
ncbi:RND transporter [Methylovorus sp. MM2]|uniref:efflux transporter outer membrane subunit n=1 Tax=Methylovorus sp. MM2 TaxID=1848038 RepID=UPI0007DF9B39|nr:efflux transporter outer membrane subunit [Methylovorus sp. MM2]OAM52532.1 RND transporter [Methylovorus sp. MM2]